MAIEFAPQCCDALQYLGLGSSCAAGGSCYDTLRPMGVIYWFALPLLLNLPQQYIIYLHWFLLLVSTALSVKVMKLFLRKGSKDSRTSPSLRVSLSLFAISLVIHLFFFIPIINNSLADVPAGFFSLFSIWLLCISAMRKKSSALLVFLAGCFLGLAAWIRAFYLYPLLVTIVVALLLWILQPKKRLFLLWILVALIPPAIQVYNTYKRFGYIAYLSREQADQWTAIHLNDSSMGYDTILPMKGERWPSNCNNQYGPFESVQRGHVLDAACVYSKKFVFYFGSYASETYLRQDGNLLLLDDDIGHTGGWANTNLDVSFNCAVAPDKLMTVEKLTVKPASSGPATVYAWVNNAREKRYKFSVWLWSDKPTKLSIALYRPDDGMIIRSKRVKLTTVPKQYAVTGIYEKPPGDSPVSSLGVKIGDVDSGLEPSKKLAEGDSFYAWGAKLTEVLSDEEASSIFNNFNYRIWSTSFLVVNVIAFLITLKLLFRGRAFMRAEAILPVIFIGASLGQSLLIIPEQRFVVVIQVVVWLMALVELLLICCSPRKAGASLK